MSTPEISESFAKIDMVADHVMELASLRADEICKGCPACLHYVPICDGAFMFLPVPDAEVGSDPALAVRRDVHFQTGITTYAIMNGFNLPAKGSLHFEEARFDDALSFLLEGESMQDRIAKALAYTVTLIIDNVPGAEDFYAEEAERVFEESGGRR